MCRVELCSSREKKRSHRWGRTQTIPLKALHSDVMLIYNSPVTKINKTNKTINPIIHSNTLKSQERGPLAEVISLRKMEATVLKSVYRKRTQAEIQT